MLYNLSLPRFASVLFLLTLLSCAPDINNPMGLTEGQLAYTLATGSERTYQATCTLKEEFDIHSLIIMASEKSDGMIMRIFDALPYQVWKYDFNKNVNIVLNEKSGKDLNIYVSKGCKDNKGQFEIVEWDKEAQTITGYFSGGLCTSGVFAHLPGTEVKEGAFYKLKYNVK